MGVSQGQTQPSLFEDPGDTIAVVFEATSRLSQYKGGEIWMGAVGVSQKWGGCNVLASQDGTKYKQIGTIEVPARLGTLQSNFPSGSDPDTVNSLIVNMEENSAALDAGSTADADQGNTLCYVDGEILSYSALSLTGQNQYTLGTYIRRGQMGSPITSHAYGSNFLRLDDAVFQFAYDPSWAGQTIFLKFQSFNTFGNKPQDLSTVTPVTFAIPGQSTAQPPASTVAVINGDFEIGSDIPPFGWTIDPTQSSNYANTPGAISYDTSGAYAGNRSLILSAPKGSDAQIRSTQKYLVKPGDSYTLQGAFKSNTSDATCQGLLKIGFYGVNDSDFKGWGGFGVTGGVTGWNYLTNSPVVVPAGSSYAYIVLAAEGVGATTGPATFEFDQIQLVRMPNLASEVAGALPTSQISGTLPISQVGARSGSLTYVIDGAGSVVTTGVKGQLSVPANCTITGWTITADQSGSAVVDVLHSTYSGFPTTSSIAGTDKPTLSSAQKNTDSTLSGWGSTSLSVGDIVQFDVDSCSTCTRLIVTLNVSITG
jgi:hypothetical protein